MVGFNLLLPLFVASSERANEPHAKKKVKMKQLVFATFRVLSSVSRKPVLVTCLKFMSFFFHLFIFQMLMFTLASVGYILILCPVLFWLG